MPRKKHTPEEIIAKLRQVDVLVSQRVGTVEAIPDDVVRKYLNRLQVSA